MTPGDDVACAACGDLVERHRDSYEWREEVHMRECLVPGCDCRVFWEPGEGPPT